MGIRILYVEDNEYLRETIGLLMEAEGRDITSVASGEDALTALESSAGSLSYDVLITDVSLPGLSGIDLARQARSRLPGVWVVLMSGYAFTSGMDEFGQRSASLAKPFDPDDLDTLIARIEADVGKA